MFLFLPNHVEMILKGEKTQTRRASLAYRACVGRIHKVCTKLYGPWHCKIRILKRWQEPLSAISEEDARKEGGYTPEEFIAGFLEMHAKRGLKRDDYVRCYEFELVEVKK